MKKEFLWIISIIIFLFSIVTVYSFVSSPENLKVKTAFKKELVKVENDLAKERITETEGGICAPPGCGSPNSENTEEITLELSAEQLTALLNKLNSNIMISGLKVKFDGGNIIASGKSYYPVLSGNITIKSRLKFNHFYVEEVYIGGTKAAKKIASFVEANGNTMIDRQFKKSNVFVKNMELENNRLLFEAVIPKGKVNYNKGVITITQ